MQKLVINKGQSTGNLWTRKPTPDKYGCIVDVTNAYGNTKSCKFIRSVFSPCGERIAVADQLGQLYILDLHKNRYTVLYRGTKYCTALDFPTLNLVVAAFSDNTVKVIDSGTQEVVGDLSTPNRTVTSLSHHDAGRYILTCSWGAGALWDLETFDRKRTLSGASVAGLKQLMFIPKSNILVTCFRDDSIFGWDCESLEHLYSLHKQGNEQPAFHAYTTTANGDFLIAGGRSRYLHVWRLQDQKLHHIVELPERVKSVKQLVALPQVFDQSNNTVFGALSQDGVVRFISLNTYKIVFTIGGYDSVISQLSVSPNAKHLAVILECGNCQVLSIKSLTKKLNAAPAPLVKAVSVPARDVKLSVAQDNSRKRRCFRELDQISKVDMVKLRKILKGYGEYPDKYRHFIWRLLLKIPENTDAYGVLLEKGTHPAFLNLQKICPVKSAKLMRVLQKVLSCLAHWSSIFSLSDFLPMLSFPFIKMFQNNHLVAFEVIATFMLNWCQGWYEYFPHPPVNILTCVENMLNFHDNPLLQHLTACQVSAKLYSWPLLYTMFSEVMSANEWMVLMDHVVSNEPGYLLCMCVAYLSCSRQVLLNCTKLKDFEYYFHNRNRVPISAMVRKAYTLWEMCPQDIHPRTLLSPLTPLPPGDYPIFNNYPEKAVNYQLKERERIHKEELQYIKERQLAEDLKGQTAHLQQQEEIWRREQGLLAEAEQQRRKILLEEENKLSEQRIRLQAMKRELRLHEVEVLDTARKNFIENAQREHSDKMRLIEDEIARKAILRDVETKGAIEEVVLAELEVQTKRGFLEQELARELYMFNKKEEVAADAQKDREHLLQRRQEIEEIGRENEATTRVQAAQEDLARSAVKSLSLKHGREEGRARHISAIYTEMTLNDIRQKEAKSRTEQERLETIIKEATQDINTDMLDQRAAIAQQRAESIETELRVEQLHKEIQNIRGGDDEHDKENTVTINRRRESLDRKQADVLRHVRDLRHKITEQARS